MVALSPRFTTLAALCSIAALTAIAPPANAAVINLHRDVADSSHAPVIPLPARGADAGSGSTSRRSQLKRRFLGTYDPALGLSDLWMGAQSRRDAPSEPGIIMAGADNSVSVGDQVWHSASDGEVVIVGDDQNLEVREPHNHHHHHHHHHDVEQDNVIIKGNNDHVNIHSREPHNHRHHHNHVEQDAVLIDGDNDHVNIHSRSVLIAGGEGVSYIVQPNKRFVAQERFSVPMYKRAGVDGVPGSIDIMSPMDDGSASQRIASLVLTPSNDTSTSDDMDAASTMSAPSRNNFVLNASPDNKTQIYLVPLSPAATEMAASTSTDPEIRVTLQIPVFNPTSASTEMWCATFDPEPPAPAPMSAASCDPSSSNDAHKSQVFAYNPSTGALRPMWYDGEDDGTSSLDDSSVGTDNLDPETPSDASIASVTDFSTPSRRDEEQVAFAASSSSASSASLSTSSISTSTASSTSSAPTSSPSSVSDSSSMTDSSATAKDVMLMFTPAEPEIMAVPASESEDVQSTSTVDQMTSTTLTTISSTATTMTSVSSSSTTDSSSYSSLSSSSLSTSSGLVTVAAMDFTESAATTTTSTASSMSAECTPSLGPCSDEVSSTTTMTSTTSSASATPSMYGALGVQVVPEAVSPSSSGSSMSAASTSTSVPATTSMTMSSDSASPSMTPVSTAPYTWMFRRDS